MVTLEAFSELLRALYAAPFDQKEWGRFLDLLCEATGSRNAVFLCADAKLGLSVRSQGGGNVYGKVELTAYREVYAPRDPYRAPVIREGFTGVITGDGLTPRAMLLGSDLYREVIEPTGLRYAALMVMTCELRRLEAFAIWRTEEEGPPTAEMHRFLEMLFPHVEAALNIRHVLGVSEDALEHASSVADASETASLLVTSEGTLLHANAAGKALLQAARGLRLEDGCVLATMPEGKRTLRRMLERDLAGAPAAMRLPVLRGEALEVLAVVQDAGVLLLVKDPQAPTNSPEEILRELYGFTPSELEIAAGLLTGYSLQEIADLRRVSLGTVRSQIKAIFRKTQTSGQAELVVKLSQMPKRPVEG